MFLKEKDEHKTDDWGNMKDKVVLIIGGGSGIGHALSAKLAEHGAKLVIAARTFPEIESAAMEARQLGAQATAIAADVTDGREVRDLVASTVAEHGRLDMVYYGAGIGILAPTLDLTESALHTMLNVNLMGLFHTIQAALPTMLGNGGGHFVIPVGILGRHVMRNSAGYSASKFAVVGMVRAIAEEYNRKNIRFTLLYLGGVNTGFWDNIDMKVQREKMLSPEEAAGAAFYAMQAPSNGVISEIVMQPESHQFI
jgi:NADP-dependent 3-hydroxy acid dehydrogenase YdfG